MSSCTISTSANSRPGELQTAIDMLTTNETYSYREAALHATAGACPPGPGAARVDVDLERSLQQRRRDLYHRDGAAADRRRRPAAALGNSGSDISSRVIAAAQRGVYPMERVQRLPAELLRRYSLKGDGPAAGTVLVDKALRRKVRFTSINLIEPLPDIGPFDVIFLRNVIFDLRPEGAARGAEPAAPGRRARGHGREPERRAGRGASHLAGRLHPASKVTR